MINLYKRTFFITDYIYTTSTNLVCNSIKELLDSFVTDIDILCDGADILYEVLDYLCNLGYTISIIYANADFYYHPVPHDLIKQKVVTVIKGTFVKTSKYDLIHQLAFLYNNHQFRMGIKL